MPSPPSTFDLQDAQDLLRVRDDDPYFAGTLAKGLLILRCFVTDPRPHANSEFARRTGLPRPTVSRLCRTLHRMGFLDHDERLDRYSIGPAAVTLAYPYVINTPLLAAVRPAMQALANRIEGAVSVGVAMQLDVVYLETCAYEAGTLKRPGVGAVRSIVETAMGRAWLARLAPAEQTAVLEHTQAHRPDEYTRCLPGVKDSLKHHRRRGFAVNHGDAGFGVLAVGVASRIPYGPRQLLFNCAVPGLRTRKTELEAIGSGLVELVAFADRLFAAPHRR